MNTLRLLPLALPIAVMLCGCQPPQDTTPRAPMPDEARLRQLLQYNSGGAVFDCFADAINVATNKEDVWPVFSARLQAQTITNIVDTHTVTEIKKKLESLRRGTNRHTYTEKELTEALAIKASRK